MSDRYTVDGVLDLASVGRHLAEGVKAINATSEKLEIDLSGSQFAGTAGIALLIAWLRHGEKAGKQVMFRGVPADLPAIARACGVETILGIGEI